MASSGDILHNPVTGSRLVWRRTTAETGGRAVVLEAQLQPNGLTPVRHVHPHQQQRVEVIAGSLGAEIDGAHSLVGTGARLTVPPGVPHRFWNAGEDTLDLVTELTPALGFESLVEALHALAVARRMDTRGRPGVLQTSAIAAEYFDTARLAFPPAPVQRLILALAAPLAHALRHRTIRTPSRNSADAR